MGNEGHTLSLFPGTKALHADGRMVVRNWIGKLCTERITLTAPVASNAAQVIFMVTGPDKAPALKAVLEGPFEPEQLPAQLLQPKDGKLLWLVDTAAGSMLTAGMWEKRCPLRAPMKNKRKKKQQRGTREKIKHISLPKTVPRWESSRRKTPKTAC